MELWKPVPGFESCYEVSNLGNVKSVRREKRYRDGFRSVPERILRPNTIKGGYLQVALRRDKFQKCYLVHRLVADVFIQNPEMLPQVNHLDGNKRNNRADNLEWCTAKENVNHAQRIGLREIASKVDMFSKNGELIRTFGNTIEAEKATGINRTNINYSCTGQRKTAGGFIWKYHSGGESNEHS